MRLAASGPKLFTCPKCRKAYLGREALPDCPACGFDYRESGGFRWDVVVYFLSILGLMSYFLVSSSYHTLMPSTGTSSLVAPSGDEKLPGEGTLSADRPTTPDARR